MRTRLVQLLFVVLVVVSGVWWFSAQTLEPFVTLLAGVIGLLTFRGEGARRAIATPPAEESAQLPAPTRRSVAVLPFNSRSGKGDDYFAEGVSDDIIAQLAQIPDLKVISRTSVMGYKEKTSGLRKIARELGVRSVLEGSVRSQDDRVRIVVQLTDSETSEQIWAERYDRELTDILAVQAQVAAEVAKALDLQLSSSAEAGQTAMPVHPEAYRLHLLGRYHANKWSRDGWEKAVTHLEEAIKADPGYAAARATLSYSLAIRAYMGLLPYSEAFARAELESRAALSLDDRDTEAHMALGLVHYWSDWDWTSALHELRRAVEISPGNSTAQTLLGSVLDTLGKHEEALAHGILGYELDPLSPIAACNLGYRFMIGRRFSEAVSQFEKALEPGPKERSRALRARNGPGRRRGP